MRKLMFFCVACLVGISAMAQDAIKVTQGSITDWYRFGDQSSIVVTFNEAGNPVFPNKTYDLAEGNVATVFGTAPAPTTYTRENLNNGKLGTICLAYSVDNLEGVDATFYQLNYYDENAHLLYLEQVNTLGAGMPYIFEAHAESFTVTLTITDEPAEANNHNGLYGTLEEATKTSDDNNSYAAIANNEVQIVNPGYSITIGANRAYIDMNEVPRAYQPTSAPLRALGVPRGQATDLKMVDDAQCTMHNGKYIIHGRFMIVKDGRRYGLLGL